MRVREAFENILIELNKVQAPSLLLDDFNYLFNKGVQEYENERYNLFETKQQLTDDLRVLTKTETILPTKQVNNTFGLSYSCVLPKDYVHILNCICEFVNKGAKCNEDNYVYYGANKLNTNLWSHIINNYYLKPSVRNPYYYIINVDEPRAVSKDADVLNKVNGCSSKEDKQENAEKGNDVRYGNSLLSVMQIKYGEKEDKYKLTRVFVDYLRAPIYYYLSQDQLDDIEDNSQVIEFPDYVIYEVINRIVKLILENGSNPRMQSHPAVNQTIA